MSSVHSYFPQCIHGLESNKKILDLSKMIPTSMIPSEETHIAEINNDETMSIQCKCTRIARVFYNDIEDDFDGFYDNCCWSGSAYADPCNHCGDPLNILPDYGTEAEIEEDSKNEVLS